MLTIYRMLVHQLYYACLRLITKQDSSVTAVIFYTVGATSLYKHVVSCMYIIAHNDSFICLKMYSPKGIYLSLDNEPAQLLLYQ